MPQSEIFLGYDLGSSSVKLSAIAADTGDVLGSASFPEVEMKIHAEQAGWAEQEPEYWWECIQKVTQKVASKVNLANVQAIGIAYQMHGLVAVDKNQKVLRPSIIWCDSRAVSIGDKAFDELGENFCLEHYLNSPGNFTASKLKWVKENEPALYAQIHKVMLPGDFVAMKMTGEINTTISGLSEGIMWDFKEGHIADKLLAYYGIEEDLIPEIVDTFSEQGNLSEAASEYLGLPKGTPISYRAGDQPNNAFSLNVLEPGELAATAGTSGVVYGITDSPDFDPKSRVNTFVHVNHKSEAPRYGVLLCVNGTGILNSWFKNNMTGSGGFDYPEMNESAANAPIGTDGLVVLPFGNGAERVLENKDINAQVQGLNFNVHSQGHMFRALQEGIVFALNYGFEVMKNMGLKLDTVKAGHANMFLSPIFREAFANTTEATIELYDTDGSQGAARGAGVGIGYYTSPTDSCNNLKTIQVIEPSADKKEVYQTAYGNWMNVLSKYI